MCVPTTNPPTDFKKLNLKMGKKKIKNVFV
jgi:hypothetical protein